ncbi:extracellular solute-binding protein [Aestuariispira insulae]|uniref:Microcin C transport system substrate-binding protein n=1 Tax=Aestuariispira insulae TaxID=1461337 RepID=A0A3D9HXW3_9PROT|nr:extracellular solute-binding protein [Aestuariispira insulae]RED54255.1 microcin C transport system substrate-binding protein [Aestuariispira insulae]
MRAFATFLTSSILFMLAPFALAADMIDGVPGRHAIAMHGIPKYPPGFTHFDYVNPDAPKGGSMKQATISDGFDSFNPIIPKGHTAVGLSLIYSGLMTKSGDEPFTMYGELAELIYLPADRSWVAFRLRETARWHDGQPITADDVIWSFETILEHGSPQERQYYADVDRLEKLDERTVRFLFKTNTNKELPLILGDLTILPKHYWTSEDRDITKTTLTPPLGSGPYKIEKFEVNRSISYKRVETYWGRDIPVHKGRYNFDRLQYDYYQEHNIALEALKAGELDYRWENTSKNWAREYEIPAVKEGRLIKLRTDDITTQVMLGLIFNQRKDLFQDRKVRQALSYVFDFTWANENIFFGQYSRLRSFFGKGDLAATGIPTGRELEILNQYRDRLPPELFTREYSPPSTDKPGDQRRNLLEAARLLKEAGWVIDPDTLMLVHGETGKPFKFDIMMSGKTLEAVMLTIRRSLKRLGIAVELKIVDSAQYGQRVRNYDYDVIYLGWAQAQSPGNEQRFYWGSAAADQPGTRNYMGLKDPIVDELIELVVNAPDRQELEARTRALDRVLQWHYLLIPTYYGDFDRHAFWNKYRYPETAPTMGYDLTTWWYDPDLARQNGLSATDTAGG